MQDDRILRYIDTKAKEYNRSFANSTIMTIGPYGEIVIDFCEEVMEPLMISTQDLSDNEILNFNHDPDVIVVEREKKFSVTLNQIQAIKMAEWIIDNCREAGEE